MENQNKKILNKNELIVVIVASLILTLGLIAAILSIVWLAQGQSNPGLLYTIGVFGDFWTVTSVLIILGVIFNWQPKTMKIISIVSICTINAAGLAELLMLLKKKQPTAKVEQVATSEQVNQPVNNQSTTDQPVNNQTVVDQAVVGQPTNNQPVDNQPVANQPVNNQPVADQVANDQSKVDA